MYIYTSLGYMLQNVCNVFSLLSECLLKTNARIKYE